MSGPSSNQRFFPPLRPHWLKTGESICVIVGVVLLVFQAFLQWQGLQMINEQLHLQREDVRGLQEVLARDAYSRSADTALRLSEALLEHPEIRPALHPSDPLNCLPTTVREAYQFLVMNVDLIANLWGFHQSGAISEQEWATWSRWFEDAAVASWLFPALWARERDYYTPAYREFVDRQLAAVAAAREASAAPTPPPDLIALATAYAPQGSVRAPSTACAASTPSESDDQRTE